MTLPSCYRWRPHPSRKELTCRQTPRGKVWRQDGMIAEVDLQNTASSADPAVDAAMYLRRVKGTTILKKG